MVGGHAHSPRLPGPRPSSRRPPATLDVTPYDDDDPASPAHRVLFGEKSPASSVSAREDEFKQF
jgi:hypothetical protein